ncbi:MAG: glutamyl-tRNA reductase [Deltaproteobacteria bacterium CG11_big_fil_rev_8_21_14_0_20_49_13]|nr:MAG: glutamyl-tRNA reductase [Deltaproteobacteria bacterium CG11_big_fil_rev_8_21_14_0_20_49_13]
MQLLVTGFNYKRSSLTVREAMAFERSRQIALSTKLAAQDVVEESAMLCTCNRTEAYMVGPCLEGMEETFFRTVALDTGLDAELLRKESYVYSGFDAISHIFRVASSLDAMVVGEAQILGQFKGAYQTAAECETAGPYLHKIFHSAFRTAKRVRTDTNIGELPVSVGTLAVEMVEERIGDIKQTNIFVIGAGEMGSLVAHRFRDRGASHIWIANRSHDSAVSLAHSVTGVAVPFDSWKTHLATADIIVASVGGGTLITRNDILAAAKEREGRPFVMLDLAIPRNVESVDIQNAIFLNIDDLQELADKNLALRRDASLKAENIIEEEARTVLVELEHLKLAPLLKNIQERCKAVMSAELGSVFAKHPDLTVEEKESMKICAHSIVKKILHDPIRLVKEELARPGVNGTHVSQALKNIFSISAD